MVKKYWEKVDYISSFLLRPKGSRVFAMFMRYAYLGKRTNGKKDKTSDGLSGDSRPKTKETDHVHQCEAISILLIVFQPNPRTEVKLRPI